MPSRWMDLSVNPLSLKSTRFSPWRIALFVLVFLAASQFLSIGSLFSTGHVEEASRESPWSWPSHVAFGTGRVSHKVATGRILVTGGGGNIGKHLVRRLLTASTPVTILDTVYYPDELTSSLPLSARSILKVTKGDIRNTTLLSQVLTPDIVGVVHLAAVSRVLWCLDNEADCRDISERGTQLVLEALSRLNAEDNGQRWFILASSIDVYGDMEKPANIYAATKLAAEKVLETHLETMKKKLKKGGANWWKLRRGGALHAVALRLSNVYGSVYDHVDRLVPSITTQALSHQVIQISGGHQHLDLLHIDDCVDGFFLAIKHLTSSLTKPSHIYLDVFNLTSGSSVPMSTIVSTLVTLTGSKSPIRYIPGDSRFPDVYRGSIEKSERILGYKPSIDVANGMEKLVRTYLKQTEHFLAAKTSSTCGRASPSLEADSDEHMDKLNKCKVHVDMNIRGEFVALVPPAEGKGDVWSTGTVMPPPYLETIISNSHMGGGGGGAKRLIRFVARNKEPVYLGAKKMSEPRPGPLLLENVRDEDIADLENAGVFVDWELEVNVEQGAVRLVVPGTNLVLIGPTFVGRNFSLVEMEKKGEESLGKQRERGKVKEIWPMRISPICCPSPVPWPFFRDDPVDFTIEYQKNSLERPFLASPARALCSRLEHARRKVVQDIATLSTRLRGVSYSHRGSPISSHSSYPTDWLDSNLPACSNACDHPTICIDTGDCQCVLSSCPSIKRFPFSSFANLPIISYPPPPPPPPPSPEPSSSSPLVEALERLSWQSIVRPQALRFIGLNVSFPRISVAPLSEDDREWVKNWKDGKGKQYDLGALREQHCLSADAQMERAIQRMGYQLGGEDEPKGAEMIFVPHYQGRWGADGRIDKTYEYSSKTLKDFDATKVIIPFTLDWGLCLTFEWNVWDLRQKHVPKVSPIVRSTTAWSVMADLNSPCYRPHQDVVIPPRTCQSPKLFEAFENVAYVRPARDRRVLVTFSGSSWGTGDLNRQRVQCARDGWSDGETRRRLYPDGPWLRALFDKTMVHDYMGILNDTIFCMQPAGVTGWSPRLVEAIYAGCIPVIIGQSSHYPFFDILDWSQISVTVEVPDLSNLENILLSRYTLEDIERFQANIMLVRDAFVYPLDNVDAEHAQKRMLDDRGPLFFALHSTRMRMMTQWPTEAVIDHPW